MILVIDNYDSFTYNLVQYLGELGAAVEVVRNDAASLDSIAASRPERIVISPGPGRPEQGGAAFGEFARAYVVARTVRMRVKDRRAGRGDD